MGFKRIQQAYLSEFPLRVDIQAVQTGRLKIICSVSDILLAPDMVSSWWRENTQASQTFALDHPSLQPAPNFSFCDLLA